MTDRQRLRRFVAALGFTILSVASVSGDQQSTPTLDDLNRQLKLQARELKELRAELEAAREFDASLAGPVAEAAGESCCPVWLNRVPLVSEQRLGSDCGSGDDTKRVHTLQYFVHYDKGFRIQSFDPARHPFSLKVNGWIQFRHHAFVRDRSLWVDNVGVSRAVSNRNAFDIERARLVFSGTAVDERLTYFLQLDGDTDGSHGVDFFDYWWAWRFSDSFQLQLGKRKVPGSRQWLLGARRTRFTERPMANDFFRPDRTVGIFAVGKVGDHGHYEMMIGNGYQTANLANSATDDRLTCAATSFFDPLGTFGGQVVDFDCSAEPIVRFGHSAVYSPMTSAAAGSPLRESSFLRLSDGTPLTQTGAIGAGTTVSQFDLWLYGIDAAVKWNGWSLNSEVFLRWIENVQADGVPPRNSLFQHGFYVEGGRFLIAKYFDFNVRYSRVSGELGDSSEYAAGCNWYPLGKPQLKVSFDVTRLDGSPMQNTASDILAGDDGTLFRTQFQAEF